jgi:hypothetical protein
MKRKNNNITNPINMKVKIITLSLVLVVAISIVVTLSLTKSKMFLGIYDANSEMRKTDQLNKSPYALFGDKTEMLMTENEKFSNYTLEIPNSSRKDKVGKLELNAKTGKIKLFDIKGNVLTETLLLPEQTARFMAIDRFAEKYYDMAPYQYAANNPILFIDVNGDSINVALIQRYDAANGTNYLQQITNDLTAQTGLTYTVTASGQMVYQTDASGNPVVATTTDAAGNTVQVGSQEARTIMTDAISNTTTAYSRITTGRSSAAVGGTLININPTQIGTMMSGAQNVDPNTMGMGMTFMHETLHSAVGGGLTDPPRGSGLGPTGAVVDRMNIVRSEMNTQGYNYGQRTSYEGVTFSPTGSPAYLPFDANSLNNLQRGIVPATTSKFLQF